LSTRLGHDAEKGSSSEEQLRFEIGNLIQGNAQHKKARKLNEVFFHPPKSRRGIQGSTNEGIISGNEYKNETIEINGIRGNKEIPNAAKSPQEWDFRRARGVFGYRENKGRLKDAGIEGPVTNKDEKS